MRAKILLGCFRTGDANDPETYVAAITAILARYPEEVMTSVTHPATGLPSKKGWLPTVKEVADACDDAVEFSVQHEARLKRIKEQMEARAREDRGEKPTLAQLKERFGDNWGFDSAKTAKTLEEKTAENRAALEQSLAYVAMEYERAGLIKPSKFALSLTARREMAERDEMREYHKPKIHHGE